MLRDGRSLCSDDEDVLWRLELAFHSQPNDVSDQPKRLPLLSHIAACQLVDPERLPDRRVDLAGVPGAAPSQPSLESSPVGIAGLSDRGNPGQEILVASKDSDDCADGSVLRLCCDLSP
jgi:hypothetical protein